MTKPITQDGESVPIPEDLEAEYDRSLYDDEPAYHGGYVRMLIKRIGRAEAALAAEHTRGWISVGERLPEDEDQVLT